MIDRRALDKAVAEGVIDDAQAERIVAIAGEVSAAPDVGAEQGAVRSGAALEPETSRDPENLLFVRGFADIFVTLGIALVVGPAVYFSATHFDDRWAIAVIIALGTWGLAEYFTRLRMMALPSIALLGLFAVASAVFFVDLLLDTDNKFMLTQLHQLDVLRLSGDRSLRGLGMWAALAAMLTAAAVALYYWRFRVPVAVAAGVAALVALILAVAVLAAPAFAEANLRWLLFASGAGVFALAMRFDMSDPERVTRRTDIAFWLHVLAAPLIVHPVLSSVVARTASDVSVADATGVLALFVAIALVSVLIDRRSFLVAGLSYAGVAFRSLFVGVDAASSLAGTLLILGAIILLLSAGWQYLRRLLMMAAPPSLALRLPPAKT